MSHYTVLVVLDKNTHEAEIKTKVGQMLAPYQEISDKSSPYVTFKSKKEEVLEEYEKEMVPVIVKKGDESKTVIAMRYDTKSNFIISCKQGSGFDTKFVLPEEYEEIKIKPIDYYKDIFDFVTSWYGYEIITNEETGDHDFGYYSNENAKWDYWTIGGRWSGKWLNKETGLKSDTIKKKNINVKQILKEAGDKAKEEWKIWEDLSSKGEIFSFTEIKLAHLKEINVSEKEFKEMNYKERNPIVDIIREKYSKQPLITEIEKSSKEMGLFFDDIKDVFKAGDYKAFLAETEYQALGTFAVLNKKGWAEKGEMLYFGLTKDEKSDWAEEWRKIFDSIPEDSILVNVDCHI